MIGLQFLKEVIYSKLIFKLLIVHFQVAHKLLINSRVLDEPIHQKESENERGKDCASECAKFLEEKYYPVDPLCDNSFSGIEFSFFLGLYLLYLFLQ